VPGPTRGNLFVGSATESRDANSDWGASMCRSSSELVFWYTAGAVLAWLAAAYAYLLPYAFDPHGFCRANFFSMSLIGPWPHLIGVAFMACVIVVAHRRTRRRVLPTLGYLLLFAVIGFWLRPGIDTSFSTAFRQMLENPLWRFVELTVVLGSVWLGLVAVALVRAKTDNLTGDGRETE